MKRMNRFLEMMAMAAMPLLFTACDDDHYVYDYYDYYEEWYDDYDWYDKSFNYGTNVLNEEAQCLRGHWEGDMVLEYTDDYGQRQRAAMGVEFEFDQYNSKSLNGRGREIDYVGDEWQELRFSWYIDPRTGDINIKYDGSGFTFRLDINDRVNGFYLDDNVFYGTMVGQNNDEIIYFDCTRTTLAKPNAAMQTRKMVGGVQKPDMDAPRVLVDRR